MDHQPCKMITSLRFTILPVENGMMVPSTQDVESYVGVCEGSLDECKENIKAFINAIEKEHLQLVQTRG